MGTAVMVAVWAEYDRRPHRMPVLLQAHYRDYGKMTYARSIFVIHNIAHQGRGPFAELGGLEVSHH